MKKNLYLKTVSFLLATFVFGSAQATNYWCDPVTGNIANAGTATSPWGMLQSVFTANKTFAAGDTIFLRSGYHGFPLVKGVNAGLVYIVAEPGQVPTAKKIKFNVGSNWVVSGLQLSPEFAGIYEKGDLVEITSGSSYITVKNCYMYSVPSVAGMDSLAVRQKFASGIQVDGHHTTLYNNILKEVGNGITIAKVAKFTNVTYNTIQGFTNDGIRGLADSCNYEYNVVKVSYAIDDNHDDGFQSWSTDAAGAIGKGTVKNVVLRGNVFISQIDANQPFQDDRGMQGTGNFDGFFENWIIENNLIISDMYEGISLYGARNCKVINNTVVRNPLKPGAYTPWIKVAKHKNGTASTGNIVRNNYTSDMSDMNGVTQSNNIESILYATYFVDYNNLDMHLKVTSPAINAGSTLDAPALDLERNPRNGIVDIGAYEYAGGQVDTTAPSIPTNVMVSSTSPRTATVRWSPSTDNLAVAGYKLYVNGINPVFVSSPATSASIKGLTPGTSYSFTVTSLDATPNESAHSSPTEGVTETGYIPTLKEPTASSFEAASTNFPANAIDNNLATRWTSVGNGEWLRLKLDTVYNITAIGAAFFNGNVRSTFFEIEASMDTVTWTKVLANGKSVGTSTAIEEFDVANMNARYIRYIGYGNSGNATTAPYNSVTELKVYSLDTISMPLPVQFLSFDAKIINRQVALNWATASEVNSHHFNIERSGDGQHFSTIANVAAKGSTSTKTEYLLYDIYPNKGINYYRLAQYDNDGKVTFSRTVKVLLNDKQTSFSVFPNPVKETLYVIANGVFATDKATFTLIDNKGAVVLKQSFPASQAFYIMPLKGKVAKGMYILNISGSTLQESLKVIVE